MYDIVLTGFKTFRPSNELSSPNFTVTGKLFVVLVNWRPWSDSVIVFILAGLFYFSAGILSREYFLRYSRIPQSQQQQEQQYNRKNVHNNRINATRI